MHRRGFIKVMAAGGAISVWPAVLTSCAGAAAQPGKPVEKSGDIRLELLSRAMLAPNSHNIQPWRVRLRGEQELDLYVDRERLLPRTDPPARQIHISQGTFLETLRIAASAAGYGVETVYFPQGEYGSLAIEDKPVASLRLYSDPSLQADPLFGQLVHRQSNKRAYSARRVPESDLAALRAQYPDHGIGVFADGSDQLRERLAAMLGRSMAIEVADRQRNIETVDIFRFSEEEAVSRGDGFTVANNGMTGIMRFIAETFFLGSREEAYAVGRKAVEIALKEGTGFMATILRKPGQRYEACYDKVPLRTVANSVRHLPAAWIAPSRIDVTDDFIRYAMPLIGDGWPEVPLEGGLQRPSVSCYITVEA